MKTWIAVAAALLFGASLTAQACDYPPLVMIPSKDKVAKMDMKAKMKLHVDTVQYLNAMEAYRTCIQTALTAAGGKDSPKVFQAVLVHRNNAAVAEEEAVQKWFGTNVGMPEGPPQQPGEAKHSKRGK